MFDLQCGVGFGSRKDFECCFRNDAKSAKTANHQLRNVEACSVLDDFTATSHNITLAVDQAHTQKKISQSSVTKAAGPRNPRRNRAANRSTFVHKHRIEGHELVMCG